MIIGMNTTRRRHYRELLIKRLGLVVTGELIDDVLKSVD